MNLNKLFKTHGIGLLNLFLAVMAAVLGADCSFAMAGVVVSTETAAEQKAPDSKGDDTDLSGKGASQSEVRESDFEPEEIEKSIAEFQAYTCPVQACVSQKAERVPVTSMEIKHYHIASPIFEVPVLADATADSADEDQTISLAAGTHIDKKLIRQLPESKCIYVKGQKGYDEDGVSRGSLALFVLSNDGKSAECRVLNPEKGEKAQISAGNHILIGAYAASESQMQVTPDNAEPIPEVLYLQKRPFNIVMTDEWLSGKKKVNWGENDLRRNALNKFKINNEITDLIGTQFKFKVRPSDGHLADEYVYGAKGILRQLNMYFSLESGKIDATDLTAIAKMMFTKFSEHNTADAICGQDFIANLLNMDLTIHKEIKFEDVPTMGMTVKAWKNNFGTINFIYSPVFDLLGFSECAALFDFAAMRKYVKTDSKSYSVDMKQGAGETREAKRDIYYQTYALGVRGFNSMLVGPAEDIQSLGADLENLTNVAKKAEALPETATDGDVIYLTKDSGDFEANTLLVYNAGRKAWEAYHGAITKV